MMRHLSEEVRQLRLHSEPELALWAGVQDSDCHCMMRYLSEEVPQLGLLYEPVVYKTVIVTVPEWGSPGAQTLLWACSVQDSDCHCMMRYLSEEVPQLGLLYEPAVYKTVIVTVPEWGSPGAQTLLRACSLQDSDCHCMVSSNVKSTIFQDRKLPFGCFRSKKDRM